MAPDKDFKVVIAGAGVAGLTLANMLEQFDIDYVVLESHSEVAPVVGASIGLFANGLRIMDQIGCYEAIENLPQQPSKSSVTRDSSGKIINVIYNSYRHLKQRHGYPVLFFDRQWLLQTLHGHLRHKDRVLLDKKVVKLDHVDGGVKVTTADGDSFSGTMVVGAGGIHSTVRTEMFRLGHQEQPGYFPAGESDRVPCYYQCSFGIAQDVPGYTEGQTNVIQGHGWSQLIVSGPENRVYWFIFVRLPEPRYGKDIPCYSKQDEAEFVKKYSHLRVTDKITFGQVFAKRHSSTLTPLHEVVFKKWFFRRIIVLGDAAHKPNPISGQGGNGAIESVAELANAIVQMRDDRPGGLSGLTDHDVEGIFNHVQSSRHARAEFLVEGAHKQQALAAYEKPLASAIVWNHVAPCVGDEFFLGRLAPPLAGGSRLKHLPVPRRPHAIPFKDDLPAKPFGEATSAVCRGAFAGGMGLLFWITYRTFRLGRVAVGHWAGGARIDRPWTGKSFISDILTKLVSIFSHSLAGQDPSATVHLVQFMTQLISPILIYTVEGYRIGNQGTLLSLPSLFMFACQLKGIGRTAPVHALVHAYQCHNLPTGRYVRPEVAKALIPALTLGYVIPTAMMLAPSANVEAWQDWTALWQFAPPLVSVLTSLFSKGIRSLRRRGMSEAEREEADKEAPYDRYTDDDLPSLNSAYTYAFWVQAATHFATLAYSYSHLGISIRKTFFGLPDPFAKDWNLPNATETVATFFRYDMALAVAAFVGSNFYSVWDLRSQGYIRTRDAVKAAAGIALGQVVVGPGATWAGLWYWRENVLAGLKRR